MVRVAARMVQISKAKVNARIVIKRAYELLRDIAVEVIDSGLSIYIQFDVKRNTRLSLG